MSIIYCFYVGPSLKVCAKLSIEELFAAHAWVSNAGFPMLSKYHYTAISWIMVHTLVADDGKLWFEACRSTTTVSIPGIIYAASFWYSSFKVRASCLIWTPVNVFLSTWARNPMLKSESGGGATTQTSCCLLRKVSLLYWNGAGAQLQFRFHFSILDCMTRIIYLKNTKLIDINDMSSKGMMNVILNAIVLQRKCAKKVTVFNLAVSWKPSARSLSYHISYVCRFAGIWHE